MTDPIAQSRCCCKHADARACLVARSPMLQRRDDVDIRSDEFIDEVCECSCHRDVGPGTNIKIDVTPGSLRKLSR